MGVTFQVILKQIENQGDWYKKVNTQQAWWEDSVTPNERQV